MKLENIKTQDEFYEFADIWYRRTLNLLNIWQNSKELHKRRMKAFYLWRVMLKRTLKLSQIAAKINLVKAKNTFHSAGINKPQ